MAINAGDLRCRVELLERKKETNDLGETTYSYGSYDPPRKLWAKGMVKLPILYPGGGNP